MFLNVSRLALNNHAIYIIQISLEFHLLHLNQLTAKFYFRRYPLINLNLISGYITLAWSVGSLSKSLPCRSFCLIALRLSYQVPRFQLAQFFTISVFKMPTLCTSTLTSINILCTCILDSLSSFHSIKSSFYAFITYSDSCCTPFFPMSHAWFFIYRTCRRISSAINIDPYLLPRFS